MHIRDCCTEVCSLELIHWSKVTDICVSKLTIIGEDNGLSPGGHQSITWTSAGILFAGPLRTNISETLIEIHIQISMQENASKNVVRKMAAIWSWPQYVISIKSASDEVMNLRNRT